MAPDSRQLPEPTELTDRSTLTTIAGKAKNPNVARRVRAAFGERDIVIELQAVLAATVHAASAVASPDFPLDL